MTNITLPISYHLIEFRIRIMYIILSVSITFLCCYYFSEQLFYLLAKPLIDTGSIKRQFIYTDITEAFVTYVKISFFTSIYMCFPVMIYQFWTFLIPGLYTYEKKRLGYFGCLSFLLFSLGASIAYFLIFPIAWKFFLSFEILSSASGVLEIQLQPKINQYILLVIRMVFLFGLCFQFPMYLVILVQMRLITSMWFIQKRNISYVASFVLSALLSPPDVLSQVILVVPLIIFYEVAIFIMKVIEEYQNI